MRGACKERDRDELHGEKKYEVALGRTGRHHQQSQVGRVHGEEHLLDGRSGALRLAPLRGCLGHHVVGQLPAKTERQVGGTQREHLEEAEPQLSGERCSRRANEADDHEAHHLQRAQALVQAGVLGASEALLASPDL